MKNKKFLVFPLIAMFALNGCGKELKPEGGNLPEGGTEVTETADANQRLAKGMAGTAKAAAEANAFGIKASFGGSVSMSSTKFEGAVALSDTSLAVGAENLFDGTKESTKLGLVFNGGKVTANYTKDKDTTAPQSDAKEIVVGKLGAYLQNGNVYVDASEAGIPAAASALAQFALPYLGENVSPMITAIVTNVAQDPTVLTTLISSFFVTESGAFNYKIKALDVVPAEAYPFVKKADFEKTEEEMKTLVQQMEQAFDTKSGLKWNDVVSVYDYKDGSIGVEFTVALTQAIIDAASEEEDQGKVELIGDNGLKAGVLFDKEGKVTGASLALGLKAKVTDDSAPEIIGTEATVNVSANADVEFVYGSNPVSFPASYDDYSLLNMQGISELIGGLFGGGN